MRRLERKTNECVNDCRKGAKKSNCGVSLSVRTEKNGEDAGEENSAGVGEFITVVVVFVVVIVVEHNEEHELVEAMTHTYTPVP